MQKVCIMVVIFLSFSSLLQTLDLIKDTWLKPEDGFPTSICLIQGLFFLFLEKTHKPDPLYHYYDFLIFISQCQKISPNVLSTTEVIQTCVFLGI